MRASVGRPPPTNFLKSATVVVWVMSSSSIVVPSWSSISAASVSLRNESRPISASRSASVISRLGPPKL